MSNMCQTLVLHFKLCPMDCWNNVNIAASCAYREMRGKLYPFREYLIPQWWDLTDIINQQINGSVWPSALRCGTMDWVKKEYQLFFFFKLQISREKYLSGMFLQFSQITTLLLLFSYLLHLVCATLIPLCPYSTLEHLHDVLRLFSWPKGEDLSAGSTQVLLRCRLGKKASQASFCYLSLVSNLCCLSTVRLSWK